MDGIICIDKPKDFTSFDVVAKCRGMLREKRMGHGGTLDPMATGVLVLFLGRATSASDMSPVPYKAYTAGFELGMETDTYDITGSVTAKHDCKGISLDMISEAAASFRGDILQVPPMYSATKVGGRHLYDIARSGKTVEVGAKKITVSEISVCEDGGGYSLCVRCSKGTYIRSIIHDIGKKLGCGAVMTSLVRTECCGFALGECVSMALLQKSRDEEDTGRYLRPVSDVFETLPKLRLGADRIRYFINGAESILNGNEYPNGMCTVWYGERFMGLGVIRGGVCYTRKLFESPQELIKCL